MSARITSAHQLDGGIRRGLWPPDTKADHETKARKLFEELDLSGLESWPPELAASTWSLLAEYHDIFSLEPSELGCTHSTKHVIKVTDDTLFKECFRQIPPPLVEEVYVHLQEILDWGMIWPSQSVQCNAVVLVQKKDRGLYFCIDFNHLNTCTKEDSYPLPRIQEALESPVGASHFSCLDLKSRFWQIKMDKSSKQYTAFTVGNLDFFECDCMPFGLCNAPATFQQLMKKLPRGAESNILPHLPWWHNCLLAYCWRTPSPFTHCFWLV